MLVLVRKHFELNPLCYLLAPEENNSFVLYQKDETAENKTEQMKRALIQ